MPNVAIGRLGVCIISEYSKTYAITSPPVFFCANHDFAAVVANCEIAEGVNCPVEESYAQSLFVDEDSSTRNAWERMAPKRQSRLPLLRRGLLPIQIVGNILYGWVK